MTHITDLDAWRRVCLDAYRNLSTDTTVTMGDVDAVLVAGARAAVALDTSTTAGATAYDHLIDRVSQFTGVGREDVDAILTQCARDAVGLLSEVADLTDPTTLREMGDPLAIAAWYDNNPVVQGIAGAAYERGVAAGRRQAADALVYVNMDDGYPWLTCDRCNTPLHLVEAGDSLPALDRRVLERHEPCDDCGPGWSHRSECHRCAQPWPCDEIRDLCDRLGINPETETP